MTELPENRRSGALCLRSVRTLDEDDHLAAMQRQRFKHFTHSIDQGGNR